MTLKSIIPMLPVKHLPVSIAFYQKLGFEIESHHVEWGWAMLRAGACRLMLDQSINSDPNAARQSVVYLYPDDIVAYHRGARSNGLDVPHLDITFYNMKEFRIEDPDGNRLWIGHEVERDV